MQSQEKHYKTVLIGSEGSGKNQLFNILCEIPETQNQTLNSIQSKSKYVEIEEKSINTQILNTPGSSQYEILRRSAYKGSQTLVFVVDITEDQSLQFMSYELELIVSKELCSYDSSAVIIGIYTGGKQRLINQQEFTNLVNLFGSYYEIQLKDKQKINDIFKSIAQQRLKFDNEDQNIKSMMERIYENIDHSALSSIKEKFQNKKDQQNQQQHQEAAAPGWCLEIKTNSQLQVEEQKKYLIKFLLIGDAQVGKSSICMNYADNTFTENYLPTIGVDFRVINKPIEDKTYKLQIWDTAGLQKFKTITQAYYRAVKVAFIVYDVTKHQSLIKAKQLISSFDKQNEEQIRYRCLVGNKIDLPRVVSTEEGMAVAQQFGTDFMEVSAKNQDELQSLFMKGIKFFHHQINHH